MGGRRVEIELIEVARLMPEHGRKFPPLEDLFPRLPSNFLDLPLPQARSRPEGRLLVLLSAFPPKADEYMPDGIGRVNI